VQTTPPLTHDEVRIQELVKDLEEHVGVNKSLQPDIKTMKRMEQIIKKPIAKLLREEQNRRSMPLNEQKIQEMPLNIVPFAANNTNTTEYKVLTEIASSQDYNFYMAISDSEKSLL